MASYDSEDMYADPGPSAAAPTPWRNTSAAKGLTAAGSSLASSGQSMIDNARDSFAANMDRQTQMMPSYRKGGTVRATGPARLHKGEVVVPRNKVKKYRRAMRQVGKKRSGSRR